MENTPSFRLNSDFRACLFNLRENGMVSNPRGSETRELLNYNITLTDPRNRVVTFPARKTNVKYLLGEFIWYLTGKNTVDGIVPYAKFWEGIINSGNQDNYPAGTVNSNYGHRMFGHSILPALYFGENKINQWHQTINILTADKDSRQAVMNIHLPTDRHAGNKDVACTLTLQWFIREDKLHLIVNMRSNDVILGFTNDVFQFTMLQECMMLQLREVYPDLQLGYYFHNAGSMHLYSRHYEMADKVIADESTSEVSMIEMDKFDETIAATLANIESGWRDCGYPEKFNFESINDFHNLSPYWKSLVKAFFGGDEEESAKIFLPRKN